MTAKKRKNPSSPKRRRAKKKRKRVLRPVRVRKVKTKKRVRSAKRVISASSPKLPKRKIGKAKPLYKTKIRLIGVGGGGSSIVSEIASRIKKADFVVANTDARALRKVSKKVKRFQFGQDLTHGLGTGMNVEIGEIAAQNEKEKIKELFEGQDLCIIVASLGGGTGSGALPVFAKISKNSDCLTYGIFTLPFEFEGEKKMEIAKESLGKIKSYLNAYSIIPNERIFQIIDKNAPLKDALSAINQKLAENLEGLIEMIYLPGLINIDFADLKTILSGRVRLAYLNTIKVKAPSKPASDASPAHTTHVSVSDGRSSDVDGEAIKQIISSPLYPYTTKGAKRVLYNIVGSNALQLSEVSQISKIISESINKEAKIIFGISQSQKLQDKIKITLLAIGCSSPKGTLIKPSQVSSRLKSSVSKRAVRKLGPVRDFEGRGKTQKKSISNRINKSNKKNTPKKTREKSKKSAIIVKKAKSEKQKTKNKKAPRNQKKRILLKVTKTEPRGKKRVKRSSGVQVKKKLKAGQENKFEKERSLNNNPRFRELGREKIRRSGLQVRKVVEEEEKEILDKEKIWETPAVFRRKNYGS